MPCGQHRLFRRPNDLSVEVSHDRHEERLIGTITSDIVIHSHLCSRIRTAGLTLDGLASRAPSPVSGCCGNARFAHARNTAAFVTRINWWTGVNGAAMISWFFGQLDVA
jgi:hypothetical protein